MSPVESARNTSPSANRGRSKRLVGVPVGGDAAVDPVVDERVGGEGGLLVEGVAVDGRG
jgi:hypothetical protein